MNPTSEAEIRDAAAGWVVRLDRGLSEAERKEFEGWLQADPRHAAAIARSSSVWTRLDRAPYVAATGEKHSRTWQWAALGGLAAAALMVAYIGWRHQAARGPEPAPRLYASEVAGLRTLHLPDGTTVFLNANSEIAEAFVPSERRVSVLRGEAHFEVAKNAARPFVVRAGPVEVRAVGTAFDVNLESSDVRVFVTEGRVRVARDAERPLVSAGERALVAFSPPAGASGIQVAQVGPVEMDRALAWQSPLLRLGGSTLAELAAKFQRRTGQRLIVNDPALANLRIGGRFQEDDVTGFVRILEDNYGLKSTRGPDGAIVLSRP